MPVPWASPLQRSSLSSSSSAYPPTVSTTLQLWHSGMNIVFEDESGFSTSSSSSNYVPAVGTTTATTTVSSTALSSAAGKQQLWTKGRKIIFAKTTPIAASPANTPAAMPITTLAQARARQRAATRHQRRSMHAGVAPEAQADMPSASEKEVAEADKEGSVAEDGEANEVLPPLTDLAFKMPHDLFRAARDAPPGSPESYWTYTLYRREEEAGTDAANGQGLDNRIRVHYCRSLHATERVCRDHFVGEPLLGFDLEWMAGATRWDGPRKNVCLVQLASPTRIGLFHLSLYPSKDELMAPTLRSILEDAGVIKAGVFIKGDCTRLRNYLGVDARGTMELSHLHKLVKYSQTGEAHLINKRLVSLADQVKEHLRLPMFKGFDVRAGDWSKRLQMDQIMYSASDAYAAVQIFSVLEKQRQSLSPTPPRPAFSELGLPIKLADGVTTIATTAEDAVEEDKSDSVADGSSKSLSPETARAAQDSIQFEMDGDGDGSGTAAPAGTTTKTPAKGASAKAPRPPRKSASPNPPKHPRIVEANNWLDSYRAQGKKVRAQPAALRAYHLWHDQDRMQPVALAALLREPPLQTSTVVSYILEAVRLEHLPYDKERLRSELLASLPEDVVKMRYSYLAQRCGFSYPGGGQGPNRGFGGRSSF